MFEGCGSGFGRSLALRFGKKGVWVYAGCLHQKSVDELTASGNKHLKAFLLDVTSSKSIRAAAEEVKSDLNGRGQ